MKLKHNGGSKTERERLAVIILTFFKKKIDFLLLLSNINNTY